MLWYGILGGLPYHGMRWDLGLAYHTIAAMGRDLNGLSQWDGIFMGSLMGWDICGISHTIPSHCMMTRTMTTM